MMRYDKKAGRGHQTRVSLLSHPSLTSSFEISTQKEKHNFKGITRVSRQIIDANIIEVSETNIHNFEPSSCEDAHPAAGTLLSHQVHLVLVAVVDLELGG